MGRAGRWIECLLTLRFGANGAGTPGRIANPAEVAGRRERTPTCTLNWRTEAPAPRPRSRTFMHGGLTTGAQPGQPGIGAELGYNRPSKERQGEMDCPNCKLVNPPNAERCDCGYDFKTGYMMESYLTERHRLSGPMVFGATLVVIALIRLATMMIRMSVLANSRWLFLFALVFCAGLLGYWLIWRRKASLRSLPPRMSATMHHQLCDAFKDHDGKADNQQISPELHAKDTAP